MKVIGVEFRLGMQQMKQLEVFVKPVNIVFPWAHPYPYGPNWSMTIHTSEGDVAAGGDFANVLAIGGDPRHIPNGISHEEMFAAYEALKKQIHVIEAGDSLLDALRDRLHEGGRG